MIPPGSKQCPKCGVLLPVSVEQCPRCGAACRTMPPPPSSTIQCPRCGTQLPSNSTFCPRCNAPFSNPHWQPGGPQPHNPLLYGQQPQGYQQPYFYPAGAVRGLCGTSQLLIVALVSIFISGWVGAILNGQVSKALWMLLLFAILLVLGFLTCGITWILMGVLELLMKIDAIVIASKLQNGEPVMPNQWF